MARRRPPNDLIVPVAPPSESMFAVPADDEDETPFPTRMALPGQGELPARQERDLRELDPRSAAAASVASFAKTRGKRKGGGLRGTAAGERARAMTEARARMATGEWEDARSSEFVALYAICHELVYGVFPGELQQPKEWAQATIAVAQFLRKEFSGDATAAYEFLRWAWKREEGREKWRRENGREGGRLGWRLLFRSGAVVTDFRLDCARRGSSGEHG